MNDQVENTEDELVSSVSDDERDKPNEEQEHEGDGHDKKGRDTATHGLTLPAPIQEALDRLQRLQLASLDESARRRPLVAYVEPGPSHPDDDRLRRAQLEVLDHARAEDLDELADD